jgi:hypothetical protein
MSIDVPTCMYRKLRINIVNGEYTCLWEHVFDDVHDV